MPRRIYDWTEIQRYHDKGHGFVECQRRFGFSHTAWVKALKRGQLSSIDRPLGDRRRRYDWAEVQTYYDEGHTYRQCAFEFGFCAAAWHKAVQRRELKPRTGRTPIERLLVRNGGSRRSVKQRLLESGMVENRCDICGLEDWQGKPIIIHLDHINGIRDDHRLENLRMLCPNCHSQTETYGAKNKGRWSLQDRPRVV
jgi:hypothetical protein